MADKLTLLVSPSFKFLGIINAQHHLTVVVPYEHPYELQVGSSSMRWYMIFFLPYARYDLAPLRPS